MSGYTPFFKGFILVGNIAIPVLPNAQFTCPQNWSLPPILGNLWQFDYGQGLRSPMIELSFVVRDNTTEALSAQLMTWALSRSTNNSDTPYIGAGGGPPPPLGTAPGATSPDGGTYGLLDVTDGISFWDGAVGTQMTGAKVASFSLGCSKGDDIRFTMRFMGSGIQNLVSNGNGTFTVTGTAVASTAATAGTTAFSVLRFPSILFGTAGTTLASFAPGGKIMGNAYTFNLSYNNNLTPDLGLNGTEFPAGLDSGLPTVGFTYTLQAGSTALIDNFAGGGTADQLAIGITKIRKSVPFAAGTDMRRIFVLDNLLDNTPVDRGITAPRVMRPHSMIALGLNPATNPPLRYI